MNEWPFPAQGRKVRAMSSRLVMTSSLLIRRPLHGQRRSCRRGHRQTGRHRRDEGRRRLRRRDPADGNAQFPFNGQDDAAFGRAVELGQDDAGQGHDVAEELGLADGILSRRGIEDEQRFLGSPVDVAAGDAGHFSQFFHEVGLSLQSACRIDQEDVDVPGFRRSRGVEDDGCRIGPFLMLDDGSADPFGPDGQLFRRGGPEGIAGSSMTDFPCSS